MLWRNISLILAPLMMEAIHPSEALILTRATWRNIQKDGILRGHCRETLKSYNFASVTLRKPITIYVNVSQ
jgi:hypothetical protein